MSLKASEFIEKFKGNKVVGAEIKIVDTLDYYILQKHGKKTDLYTDRDVEYPEEPPLNKEKEVLIKPMGVSELGMGKGVFTLAKKSHRKKSELIKTLKNIEEIEKYIDFTKVSKVIYTFSSDKE